jgi:hypothetical protein
MLKKALKQYSTASLILIGSILWSLTMIKSGWQYKYGIGFWGANGHDGIWHLALSNNLSKFNFNNPIFDGMSLQNYHFGFDLFLALIHKISFLPISLLYFQILPPIFAILIGYLTYVFVFEWSKSKKSALFSVFFVYLGGSASWILGKGESAFWAQQSISTLINPPFALSLIFILLGLILLNRKKTFWSIIVFGLLIQIKVYAGLLVLGGLFVSGMYEFVVSRKVSQFKIFLGSLFVSIVIFLPFNLHPQSLITWQPFWFLETMMSYSDRVGWQRFYSAMTTYKMGNLLFKEMSAYVVAFLIFLIGNFWTRILFVKDLFKNIDSNKIMILSIFMAGIAVPMFFVQKGTPWNTIQFVYYSLFFGGMLAGMTLSKINNVSCLVVVLLTIPTTYLTLKDVYVTSRPPARMSHDEFEALSFLRIQPDGVVLTYPFDSDKAKEAINNPPRPLYLYDSTAYTSAYSEKQLFLEDEVNLNIMGYDWKSRRDLIINWYKETNMNQAQDFLVKNNIKYIYWVKPQRALLGESQLGLVKIFENNECIIYRYGKDLGGN